MKRYAGLIGNYKNIGIKSLMDNNSWDKGITNFSHLTIPRT